MSRQEITPEYLAIIEDAVASFARNTRPGFIHGVELMGTLTNNPSLVQAHDEIRRLGLKTTEYIDHMALRYGGRVALDGALKADNPTPLAHYIGQFKQQRQSFKRWPFNQLPDRSVFGIVPRRLTSDSVDTEINDAIVEGDYERARKIFDIGTQAGVLPVSTRVIIPLEMGVRIGHQWLTYERDTLGSVGVYDVTDCLVDEHTLQVFLANE